MVRRVVACIALASIAAAAACGSRGPLDDSPFDDNDGGTGTGTADAAPEAAPVVDAAPDAPVDAGHDATIIDCVQCITNNCTTQIFQCVSSQPCQQAFACVAQMCLAGGGGFDPSCLLGCASGNAQGALQVLEVFMCVQGTCGTDCTSLLGGLGGLGGGGGGGGGGGKGRDGG